MIYLYIIGPVTGKPDDNLDAFIDARRKLESAGYLADYPHRWVGKNATWEHAMSLSIQRMMTVCDHWKSIGCGVAMLPGWEDSNGAKIEHDLAEALGIPCKTVEEWLKA